MLQYHAEGFRQAGAEVVAIADVNEAAAQAAADELEVPRAFGDVAQMYASLPDLDAVSIITPNKFHHPLVMQALEAGKAVFCEKPPALNAMQVEEMAEAAERSGKVLMFDFNNRARPESMAMMQYIQDGVVGQINSCQAKWIRRTGIPGFGGWFTTKELSGGGPLIDLLHMIDLGLYFMQYPDPEWVLAGTFDDHIRDKQFKGPWGIADREGGTTDVESAAHGFVRFKTGQVLYLACSWAEFNAREEVSVTFQGVKAGGLVERLFDEDGIDSTATDTAQLYTLENGVSIDRDFVFSMDEAMGRERAAANFIYALDGKEAPLNRPDEAIKLMKIIDAVYASAQSGEPQKIQ